MPGRRVFVGAQGNRLGQRDFDGRALAQPCAICTDQVHPCRVAGGVINAQAQLIVPCGCARANPLGHRNPARHNLADLPAEGGKVIGGETAVADAGKEQTDFSTGLSGQVEIG